MENLQALTDEALNLVEYANELSALDQVRVDYLGKKGQLTAFDRQDSSLLTVLADANALLIRPIADPARAAGETVQYLPI